MSQPASKSTNALLSPREKQVLRLAAAGLTDRATAHALGVSLATIGTYWGRVQIKFGSYNRIELARMYLASEDHQSFGADEFTSPDANIDAGTHSPDAQLLQVSLELFRGLIHTANDAILVLNQQGIVELANEKTDRLFGYNDGELSGLTVDVVLPKWYHQGYLRNVVHYAANHRNVANQERIQTTAMKKDRSEFPISAALNATPSPRGMLVTCILQDSAENSSIDNRAALESPLPAIRLK